jgi:pimeloyl-ACP methyl ester carboxylesterase
MKTRQLIVPLLLLSGCLNLDGFVWFGKKVDDPTGDLMAASIVPADLRQEIFNKHSGIISADGTLVDAYLLKHKAGDGTPESRHNIALLYCHGQSNNVKISRPRTDALWKMGYTVLAVDQRGFGKTDGVPTDPGVYADTIAAYKWLAAQQPAFHVGVYGRSLGTAICLKAAVDQGTKALALESPIASIRNIIDDSTTLSMPSDFYVDPILDNLATIPSFKGNLLIMHGTADTYVPPKYGQQLHDLAQGHAARNTFWLVTGADHGTVPCVGKTPAAVSNDCVDGFSRDYTDTVTALFDTTFSP